MNPHAAFAKTCAEQIMCTRHIPGIRAEIEKSILNFDEATRPIIISLVKQEIHRIKQEQNIDGATVIAPATPSAHLPKPVNPTKSIKSIKSVKSVKSVSSTSSTVAVESTWIDSIYGPTDEFKILRGRDLGCSRDEEASYDQYITKLIKK